MRKVVAIVGTFDSKGRELLYLKEIFKGLDLDTITIDCGVFEHKYDVDIKNEVVLKEIGIGIKNISEKKDRALATEKLSKAMAKFIPKLHSEGKFDGIISLGGTGGTSLATSGMRELPVGVPKIMVSTVASGNTSQYVGSSDIIMIPSIVESKFERRNIFLTKGSGPFSELK